VDLPAYIAEQRHINSQVLSDTIARITVCCVSFSAAAPAPEERSTLFREDFKDRDGGEEWRA
jgi:hypothetical protein